MRCNRNWVYKALVGVTVAQFLNCGAWLAAATLDFQDHPLSAGGYWNGSDSSGGFTSQGAFFNNSFTDWGGGYTSWGGWALSNVSDTTTAVPAMNMRRIRAPASAAAALMPLRTWTCLGPPRILIFPLASPRPPFASQTQPTPRFRCCMVTTLPKSSVGIQAMIRTISLSPSRATMPRMASARSPDRQRFISPIFVSRTTRRTISSTHGRPLTLPR